MTKNFFLSDFIDFLLRENSKIGTKKNIQKKFLKKACSNGCTEFPINFMTPPSNEKKKQDATIRNIGEYFRFICCIFY